MTSVSAGHIIVTPTQPVSHIQVENYTALKLSSTVPQRHSAVIKSTLQCGMVNTATRKHNYIVMHWDKLWRYHKIYSKKKKMEMLK